MPASSPSSKPVGLARLEEALEAATIQCPPPPPSPPSVCQRGNYSPQKLAEVRRSPQILVEEIEDRLVGANFILLLGEAVAFVVEDDVFDHAVLFLDRFDDFVRFRLDHARIVRALQAR